MPERGIDQLAGADVRGAVVLILFEGPEVEGFPSVGERVQAVDRGRRRRGDRDRRRRHSLDRGRGGVSAAARPTSADDARRRASTGIMPMAAAQRLIARRGRRHGPAAERPARLLLPRRHAAARAASLDVTTPVRRVETSNVIGRLRGSGATGESRAAARPLGPSRPVPPGGRGRPDLQRRGRQCERHRGADRDRRPALAAATAPGARHPVPRHHRRGDRACSAPAISPSIRPCRSPRSSPRSTSTRSPSHPAGDAGRGDRPRRAGARRAGRRDGRPTWAAGSTRTTRPPPSSSARTAGR